MLLQEVPFFAHRLKVYKNRVAHIRQVRICEATSGKPFGNNPERLQEDDGQKEGCGVFEQEQQVVADVIISDWLFLTILSASFYLALGKRRNELQYHKINGTRSVLNRYTLEFLDKNLNDLFCIKGCCPLH